MAARVCIGISGWRYALWRGIFYPKDLPQRRELEYASRWFSALEINGSFYSLQRPECYASWYAQTPAGFTFAVKGGGFITHLRKLRDIEEPLANFLASGPFNLREKLGPILWHAASRGQVPMDSGWCLLRGTVVVARGGALRCDLQFDTDVLADAGQSVWLRDPAVACVAPSRR